MNDMSAGQEVVSQTETEEKQINPSTFENVRYGFKETTLKKKDEVTGKMVPVLDEKGKEKKVPAHNPVNIKLPQFVLPTEEVKDEKGNTIIQEVGRCDELMAVLKSGDVKQIRLLADAANGIIQAHAKLQLDEAIQENKDVWPKTETRKDEKGKEYEVIVQEADESWLDVSKLDWGYIANLPPATRGAAGIPEEVWNAFAEDYKEVIQRAGKTKEQAEAGAKHCLSKFAVIRLNPDMLRAMQGNLNWWFANTTDEKREEFQKPFENLTQKLNTLLQVLDANTITATI